MTKFCLLPMLVLLVALQAAEIHPDESAGSYEERLVVVTVVAVTVERSLITIREPDLLGRVRIRFKCYHVKQPFVRLSAGISEDQPIIDDSVRWRFWLHSGVDA